MTDLLGTPLLDTVSRIRNEKARRYLSSMRKKQAVPFSERFPKADPAALKLLQKLLAFDPKDRPTAEDALADPYFKGLAKVEREPSCQPITKMEFEFERRKVTKEDVKELIFREILEYHPQLLKDYMNRTEKTNFLYPSAIDNFRRQFASLEENGGKSGALIPSSDRKHVSLPRTTTVHSNPIPPNVSSQIPQRIPTARPGRVVGPVIPYENSAAVDPYNQRRVARNPVLPLATSNLSAYTYHRKLDNSDTELQQELEKDRMQYQPAQRFMDAKVVPQMSPDLRSSCFIPKGVPKADVMERAALQSSMIQVIAPFNGIAAVGGGGGGGGGYSKVNAVQYGVSRMY
uniref:Protein kinase domain-containing protein n=1 Tax=Arundo donax TaxID=35708 RepID=A0A0A9E657_ARUDO